MRKGNNPIIYNEREIMKYDLEKMKKLQECAIEMNVIGKSLGVRNIHDKDKWKELIIGSILNDTVFDKASGEEKGADARNNVTGNLHEYKSTELLSERHFHAFMESVVDGTETKCTSMTYNNGYNRENVESYRNIRHFNAVWYGAQIIAITWVYSDHVCSDLMKRVILTENGKKYKSTNGNGVGVHYENGGVREGEGEIVYLNDIRK